jgi:hypothetical protein
MSQINLFSYFLFVIIVTPHWARVVGFGPFSFCVIHKEGLCSSSGDINRLMMNCYHRTCVTYNSKWLCSYIFLQPTVRRLVLNSRLNSTVHIESSQALRAYVKNCHDPISVLYWVRNLTALESELRRRASMTPRHTSDSNATYHHLQTILEMTQPFI